MKYLVPLALVLLLLAPARLFAFDYSDGKEVVVQALGTGANETAALDDALRNAASQAFQTFVLSETKTRNYRLVDNRTTSLTQGLVKSYSVVGSQPTGNGGVRVEAKVTLSLPVLSSQAGRKGQNFEAQMAQLKQLGDLQAHRRRAAQLLDDFFGNPEEYICKAYSFQVVGVDPKEVGPDYIEGDILVRVLRNELFFKQYQQLLQTLAVPEGEKGVLEGLLESPAEIIPAYAQQGGIQLLKPEGVIPEGMEPLHIQMGTASAFFGLGIVAGYRIPTGLAGHLPTRALNVGLTIGGHRYALQIVKNAVVLNSKPYAKNLSRLRSLHASDNDPRASIIQDNAPLFDGGSIYVALGESDDPTVAITQGAFTLRIPFRTRNQTETEALLHARVRVKAQYGDRYEVTAYRYAPNNTWFYAEN